MNKTCYRYLVFNNTWGYSHEITTDEFYGYNLMSKNGKPIPMMKDIRVTISGEECLLTLYFYEDRVYNKSKAELENERKEAV